MEEVFNMRNTGMRIYKSEMRLRALQALLKKEMPFAGFKRHYVRERLDVFPELSEYVL